MYYENGNVSEEGIWKNNKWVGEYKFYFESGNLAYEWSYSETGKRTGTQKYYHENGQVMIEGDWNEGKESGILREYDEKGNLVQEKNYVNGELDKKSVKTYGPDAKPNTEKPVIKYEKPEDIAVKKDTIKHKPTQNSGSLDLFTGTGYSKLFTKTGQVEQEGYFVKGVLQDGKKYYYNDKNILVKTAKVLGGKIVEITYADPTKK